MFLSEQESSRTLCLSSLSLSLSVSLSLSFSLSHSLSFSLYFGGTFAHQLMSLQKRTVKLVVKAARVLPLQSLADFQRSLLIMKSTNDKVPQYTKAPFTLCPNDNNRFKVRLPRLDIYKSHSIPFSAVMSWNSLPINLRSSMRSMSLSNLKRKLGYYLLSNV